MELQQVVSMMVKTQPKIKTKLVLQHPIQYPPSSQNTIFDTGTTNFLFQAYH